MKFSKDRHTLHPLHYSMQPHLRRTPNDMTRLRDVDPEIMSYSASLKPNKTCCG